VQPAGPKLFQRRLRDQFVFQKLAARIESFVCQLHMPTAGVLPDERGFLQLEYQLQAGAGIQDKHPWIQRVSIFLDWLRKFHQINMLPPEWLRCWQKLFYLPILQETLPPTYLTAFLPATESGARSTALSLQRLATTANPPPAVTSFATVTRTKARELGRPEDL